MQRHVMTHDETGLLSILPDRLGRLSRTCQALAASAVAWRPGVSLTLRAFGGVLRGFGWLWF